MPLNKPILDRFQKIFGEGRYDREMGENPGMRTMVAYRDRGFLCRLDWFQREDETDEEIINKYLSVLTFDELNALDKNGISLLHLAVFLNRGGLYGRAPIGHFSMESERNTVKTGSCQNIVDWLLENESFYQKGSQGTLRRGSTEGYRCSYDEISGTALHFAFCAQLPKWGREFTSMEFNSENHGGRFGRDFVAGEALDAMLRNRAFMHSNVNALNIDGLRALELAVHMASLRLSRMKNIFFGDGCRFGEDSQNCERRHGRHIDGSITYYKYEYQYYIKELLKNEYIRTHSMFGLRILSQGKTRYLIPRFDFNLTSGMKTLAELCNSGRTGNENDSLVKLLLEILLTEDAGNLKDAVKAQGLAIAIDPVKGWQFKPFGRSKEAGGVLREFFRKHAISALFAVERHILVLLKRFEKFKLIDVRDSLFIKHGLSTTLWKNILSFASYRNDNEKNLQQLYHVCTVINEEIRPFFFGGIQSCIDRKLEEQVPSDAWELVFEFAGLSANPSTEGLDDSMGPIYTPRQTDSYNRDSRAQQDQHESDLGSSNEDEGECSSTDDSKDCYNYDEEVQQSCTDSESDQSNEDDRKDASTKDSKNLDSCDEDMGDHDSESESDDKDDYVCKRQKAS